MEISKADIVKTLLKELSWQEIYDIQDMILSDTVREKDDKRTKLCQICREEDASFREGISRLKTCGKCYNKIWRRK